MSAQISRRVASLFAAVAFVATLLISFNVTTASTAHATGAGNNGTIKIHEKGTPDGTENNDPKVCVFNVEGFNFDEGQEGYLKFSVQGGDGPTGQASGPHAWGPTNSDGYYASEYFNLKPGHYKATLYGKDTGGGINLDDVKAKSKVFKVSCEPEEPPVNPAADVSVSKDCESITVDVTGVKPEGAPVVITDNGTVVGEGSRPVSAGTHVIKVTVSGEEVFSKSYVIEKCPVIGEPSYEPNHGSCTMRTPSADVTAPFPTRGIGYQIKGQQNVWPSSLENRPAGTYTVTLPSIAAEGSVVYRIAIQSLEEPEPFYSEWFTFTAGTDCGENPPPPPPVKYCPNGDIWTDTNGNGKMDECETKSVPPTKPTPSTTPTPPAQPGSGPSAPGADTDLSETMTQSGFNPAYGIGLTLVAVLVALVAFIVRRQSYEGAHRL